MMERRRNLFNHALYLWTSIEDNCVEKHQLPKGEPHYEKIRAEMRENVPSGMRAQQTQVSLRIRAVCSESSLSAWWRKSLILGYPKCTQWRFNQTARMCSLIWIFAGRTCPTVSFLKLRVVCRDMFKQWRPCLAWVYIFDDNSRMFSYFSVKTHCCWYSFEAARRLVLIRSASHRDENQQHMCFYGELEKIILELSLNTSP